MELIGSKTIDSCAHYIKLAPLATPKLIIGPGISICCLKISYRTKNQDNTLRERYLEKLSNFVILSPRL